MDVVQLLLSLGVVTVGAEVLVRGASLLALRFGVSPLFVGLTVVGFGTSSPELAASLVASLRGSSDVSVGNVVGSNIFNVAVIVGIAALIYPLRVHLHAIRRELGVAVVAAVVPWLSLLFGSRIPRPMGWVLVGLLCVYVAMAYRSARRAPTADRELVAGELQDTIPTMSLRQRFLGSVAVNVALVVGGLCLLIFGAQKFVGAAIALAQAFGVPELVIGLTIVAAGTSLPELVTSVVAGIRRHSDIAIGNIIGSNIFNIFGILGVSAIVRPQVLAPSVLWIDVPVMLAATIALFPVVKTGGVISRLEGVLLLAGYVLYLSVLVIVRGS